MNEIASKYGENASVRVDGLKEEINKNLNENKDGLAHKTREDLNEHMGDSLNVIRKVIEDDGNNVATLSFKSALAKKRTESAMKKNQVRNNIGDIKLRRKHRLLASTLEDSGASKEIIGKETEEQIKLRINIAQSMEGSTEMLKIKHTEKVQQEVLPLHGNTMGLMSESDIQPFYNPPNRSARKIFDFDMPSQQNQITLSENKKDEKSSSEEEPVDGKDKLDYYIRRDIKRKNKLANESGKKLDGLAKNKNMDPLMFAKLQIKRVVPPGIAMHYPKVKSTMDEESNGKHLEIKPSLVKMDKSKEGPTYSIRPPYAKRFKPDLIKEAVNSLMVEELSDKEYNPELAADWTQNLTQKIRTKVQEFEFERYKFAVQVMFIEQKYQGIKVGTRVDWDSDTDNMLTNLFTCETFFCVVMIFGTYYY